ncbi:hypothetical protein IZY60_04095 [Lutibacter sp. B2]|nr:hypothetical protein [Lutibacter sp. B2]
MEAIKDTIELIKEDVTCEYLKVFHFEKELNNYKSNIVCCEFKNQEDLRKNWQEIMKNVSFYIQAKLSKIIELYNIYILFFAKEIDHEVMYKIEQDKYSSRKIIVQREMPEEEEELKKMVNEIIFEFRIEISEENLKLEDWLKNYNEEIYDFVKGAQDNTVELEDVMNILK